MYYDLEGCCRGPIEVLSEENLQKTSFMMALLLFAPRSSEYESGALLGDHSVQYKRQFKSQ
jgi:hypothetical protein